MSLPKNFFHARCLRDQCYVKAMATILTILLRLKMNFIDVGDPTASAGLNRAKCPVLAWSYSEPFQVYSAKKFPGVIESTPLSRSFAAQGIKIPIRKEGKADKNEDDED